MKFFRNVKVGSSVLSGDLSTSLALAHGRIVLLSGFFMLAYILLFVRVFDLSVLQAQTYRSEPSGPKQVAEKSVKRARILDRNGTLLATTLQVPSLFADPYLISSPVQTAKGLVRIFPELTYGDALQKLQGGGRFVWLARDVTPAQQEAVLALGEPGLGFSHEGRRIYPQGDLAAHIIGYAGVDNQGLAGIERSFDNLLLSGESLALSIDVRLQHVLKRELSGAVEKFEAKGGAGVIMDVNSGEILAGVSYPAFDPHQPAKGGAARLFNRLTLGVYELGSVFKIFSTAAFLDTKNVPMSTKFDASEPIKIGRFTINDYHAENRILSLPEVFMHSSNIGSAMMGRAIGDEVLYNFYRDIGLLTPMEIEVPEIGRPLVPDPWREVNTLTAAYGHGLATTPLQVASAVASIVNGGYLVEPTFIKSESNAPRKTDLRVISQETSHRMRQLLRLVVTDGTGGKADVPGYLVGGKTGTAEKSGANGYDRDRLISSFIAVFPMDKPQYAVFVLVDEPKGQKRSFGYATGGWVAAPAVARVITSMASILGIPPRHIRPEDDLGASLKRYVEVSIHE